MNAPTPELTHAQVQALLRRGEPLDPARATALQRHLAACRDCWEYAALTARLEADLPAALPPETLAPAAAARLRRTLQAAASAPPPRRAVPSGLGWALGTVALLLVLVGSLTRLLPTPELASRPPATELVAPAAIAVATAAPGTDPLLVSPAPAPAAGYTFDPYAGFVELDAAWLLTAPQVAADALGAEQVILRQAALSADRLTVWLEVAPEMNPRPRLEGATLSSPTGDLLADTWDWLPVTIPSAAPQARLIFPAADLDPTAAFTLRLPDGWTLPVRLTSAADLGLPPVDLPPTCAAVNDVTVCALAAVTSSAGTEVLLTGRAADPAWTLYTPLLQPAAEPVSGLAPTLRGGGAVAALHVLEQRHDFAPAGTPNAGRFDPLPAGTPLALDIPLVTLRRDVSASLTLDLGPNPAPGVAWDPDLTLSAAGLSVHFSQATLRGDGVTSLELELTSDPVVAADGRLLSQLEIARPAGIDATFGYGFDGAARVHHVTVELIQPDGSRHTGRLTLPVAAVQAIQLGPFQLAWTQPTAVLPTPRPPEAVPSAAVSPPPPTPTAAITETAFRLEAVPAPGQPLALTLEAETTTLWGGAGVLASLPGRVYHFFPLTDGAIYVRGVMQDEGTLTQAEVYRLDWSGRAPTRLLGPLAYLDGSTLSADGRYLLLTTRRERPDRPTLQLLDLSACATGACDSQLQPLPEVVAGARVGCPVWSPTGHKLAFCGVAEGSDGAGDVYLADLDVAPGLDSLGNFSESPDRAEGFAPVWLPDGSGLVWVCETLRATNDFGVCRRPFGGDTETEVLAHFPTAPTPLVIDPSGESVLFPVYAGKGGEPVTWNRLDLRRGSDLPLLTASRLLPPVFAPAGGQVLYLDAQGWPQLLDLASGQATALLRRPAVWLGWAR